MNTQTILTSARVSCYREIPDYYSTKNLAIGPWYLNDDDMAAYVNHPTFDPTWLEVGERNQHDYAIAVATVEHQAPTGWAVMESRDAAFAEGLSMDYFNACVKDALAFNW